MRWRLGIGCLLAIAAVAVAGPPDWLPWGGWVRQLAPAWWNIPVFAAGLLLLAGLLLPGAPTDRPLPRWWPVRHRGEHLALGLGLLLLLEPLLHLAVLAYLGNHRVPGDEAILFPIAIASSTPTLAIQLLVLCLLSPLAEEWFFRGRLLPWLADSLGPWAAISLTSLLFACAHGSPIACLVAAPIGVLLGWMRLQRNDLGTCVMVHQAHNALFLFAGPMVVSSPMAAMVLAGSGALMLALAAARGPAGWRALPVGLGLAVALALALPSVQALNDRLWVQAATRTITRSHDHWVEPLMERLEAQRWNGRLSEPRVVALRANLERAGGDVARAARLLLDGHAAQAATTSEALADLRAISACPCPSARVCAAATALGTAWPDALSLIAVEDPGLVALWLGPDGALQTIAASDSSARRRILGTLEQVWPGRLASVLFRLQPEQVTALDRRHVRMHYIDANAMIAALDPERRAAWLK